MEMGVYRSKNESPEEEIIFDDANSDAFLPKGVENFYQKIDPEQTYFSYSLDEDEVWGLIDLYARTIMRGSYNASPEVVHRLDRLMLHLQGLSNRDIANKLDEKYQTIFTDYDRASRLIRDKLSELSEPTKVLLSVSSPAKVELPKLRVFEPELLVEPTVDAVRFSPEHVERFRQEVNEIAGSELLPGPLDQDEVLALIELYGRKYRSRRLIGRLAERLTTILEGEKIVNIAKEVSIDESSIRTMKRSAATLIARELRVIMLDDASEEPLAIDDSKEKEVPFLPADDKTSEVPASSRTETTKPQKTVFKVEATNSDSGKARKIIESFFNESSLPENHKESLRYHLGFNTGPLSGGTIQQRNDACEKVRELIANATRRDRSKYSVIIDNLPAPAQLQVVGRMLGNRQAAISPISYSTLIGQYETELRMQHENASVSEDMLQQRVNRYSELVDQALAQTLDWATSPKYRYDTEKPVEESA